MANTYGPQTPTKSLDQIRAEINDSLDLGNLDVEQTAVTIAKDYPGVYNLNQVSEVYDALRKGWYYYSDPSYKDKFKSANHTLKDGKISNTIGMGDCDDFAILMASLLESLQGSTRIVFAYDQDTRLNHAYAEVYLGKKDDPRVDELISWLKDEYNQNEITGQLIDGEEAWLNLDYNSTYPGGAHFGGGHRVEREVVWQSTSRNSPRIVPIIDTMDSTNGWEVAGDEKGSAITISSVPSPKGKAIQIDFDLVEGGWIGISKNVSGSTLSQVRGLNLSYYGLNKQITIQFGLVCKDGTKFKYSLKPELGNKWASLEVLFEDFARLDSDTSSNKADQILNPNEVERLEIISQLNENDSPGTGCLIIDNIRGVMNIPMGSPWTQYEAQKKKNLAMDLASRSEMVLDQDVHMIGQNIDHVQIEGTKLAVESLNYYETLAGKQALLHGMGLLPCPITRIINNASVSCVAFSPDGKRLALGGYDNTAKLLDIDNGTELARMEHDYCVDSVIFSPNGRRLATTSENNIVWLWDARTGRGLVRTRSNCIVFSPDGKRFATADGSIARLWDAETGNELAQIIHGNHVISIIFSPEGNEFATASSDQVRIFDADAGRELTRMEPDSSIVNGIALNPNGNRLALANGNQAVIWDVENEKETVWMKHDNKVISVLFSPDGRRLATVSDDHAATLWDSKTGDKLARTNLNDKISLAAFSYDGMKLAVISHNTIIVMDVENSKELARIEHSGPLKCIAFSPDNTKLTAGGGSSIKDDFAAKVWDTETGKELFNMIHRDSIEDVAFSPDGKKIATASIDRSVMLWDIRVGESIASKEINITVNDISFSPDGTIFAATSGNLGEDRGKVSLWDAETYKELVGFDFNSQAKAIAFSSTGKEMAIALADGTISLFDVHTGKELAEMEHNSTIISLKISNDGERLAAAGDNGLVRLWDLQTGKKLSEIKPENAANSASFTSDCASVAMDSSNNTATIWDSGTGEELARVKCNGQVFSVAFSPDDGRLATGSDDSTARIWDVLTREEQVSMYHDDLVLFVAFSPDGKKLVTRSMDATARIWDAVLGEELERLYNVGIMHSAAFSPDGRRLAIKEWGETVSILPVSSDDLICLACNRLKYLTSEKWQEEYCRGCSKPNVHSSIT
ncbi:MAG TPA: PQQ-binding-like beta-propeller repeat protein [Methanothrix sp.]|jgi:WD40 repeat protein|nr:transglutaminase domain-containing protein [Methanothrix sp.]HRU75724.1 PQQ-binding-like beta-propeller repeat protein [Methanothrix sp.]